MRPGKPRSAPFRLIMGGGLRQPEQVEGLRNSSDLCRSLPSFLLAWSFFFFLSDLSVVFAR